MGTSIIARGVIVNPFFLKVWLRNALLPLYVTRLVEALAARLGERAWVKVAVQEYESARALLARAEEVGWWWEKME